MSASGREGGPYPIPESPFGQVISPPQALFPPKDNHSNRVLLSMPSTSLASVDFILFMPGRVGAIIIILGDKRENQDRG